MARAVPQHWHDQYLRGSAMEMRKIKQCSVPAVVNCSPGQPWQHEDPAALEAAGDVVNTAHQVYYHDIRMLPNAEELSDMQYRALMIPLADDSRCKCPPARPHTNRYDRPHVHGRADT